MLELHFSIMLSRCDKLSIDSMYSFWFTANRFPTVPSWEKKFCNSVGSVPWRKVIEGNKYMCLHPKVVNWNDSAVKEAFDNAKNRFWAEINGLPCDIPVPDPDIYIDDVDWNASIDPELYLDVEREAEARRNMEQKPEAVVILGSSLLLNQSLSGPGWGDEEENVTKPSEPNYAAQGWQTNSWEQYHAPVDEHAKEYGWKNSQNDSQRWTQREHYGGDLHNKYQGRNGWNSNWATRDGYNRERENNMSRSMNPGYHHGNLYPMGRGRNGGRGGGMRGHFNYVHKVVTPTAW